MADQWRVWNGVALEVPNKMIPRKINSFAGVQIELGIYDLHFINNNRRTGPGGVALNLEGVINSNLMGKEEKWLFNCRW